VPARILKIQDGGIPGRYCAYLFVGQAPGTVTVSPALYYLISVSASMSYEKDVRIDEVD
jgi:hypothetical protein